MKCYHCGDECTVADITYKTHHFCCTGCKTVYQLLQENDLDNYYNLEASPGVKQTSINSDYGFLNEKEVAAKLVYFDDGNTSKVSFNLPQIHCSSCVWLLEHLHKLHKGVVVSNVDFSRRQADITFNNGLISLAELAELLHSIGYEPELTAQNKMEKPSYNKILIYKVGVAGFCFGNIMLITFPEYLGITDLFADFRSFFGYLAMFLAFPVMFYSGTDYLIHAIGSIKQRYINMDVPIALGMLTLFIRSSYEVISGVGSGYFDSLSGLVFFLLLGKWFQDKTYTMLSFERDYKSYFPMAVKKIVNDKTVSTTIEKLIPGDVVELRNNEIIPADAILLDQQANIDYSFVTGESKPVVKQKGELIYAGGRQIGSKIRVQLSKKVNNSYLTKLWNNEAFQKKQADNKLSSLSNTISKYFTIVVLLITLFTALFWSVYNPKTIWSATTAVLIVACPCALALSVPFTYGNLLRLLGKKGFYLKGSEVIETLAKTTMVVFDKTGTLTHKKQVNINYHGEPFNEEELQIIKSTVSHSIHPLSVALQTYFEVVDELQLDTFGEIAGKGIIGVFEQNEIKIGSATWLKVNKENINNTGSRVYVSINNDLKGYFEFQQYYRSGLQTVITRLKQQFKLALLSGDNNEQQHYINELGIGEARFNQTPFDKLEMIKKAQANNERVVMVGDGLNDAGALKQSDVGITVSDQVNQFSPSCDIILDARQFKHLPTFLNMGKVAKRIVYLSFLLSFLYNIVGLFFAVQGLLSPVFAAVLMPLSSISVVLLTTILTHFSVKSIS